MAEGEGYPRIRFANPQDLALRARPKTAHRAVFPSRVRILQPMRFLLLKAQATCEFLDGGGGGIRTLVTWGTGKTVFETAAFNHSATPPYREFIFIKNTSCLKAQAACESLCGGETGIRTPDTLMAHTRFPIVLLQPSRTSLHIAAIHYYCSSYVV